MTESHNPTTTMSQDEALQRIGTAKLGRLVVHAADELELFPVNFVVHDGKIYFRTAEGTKLFSLALDRRVLFEADAVDGDRAWSVVVKGAARRLESSEEIQQAEKLPLRPWLPTLKYNFVEITPAEVSGRDFELGEEPERYQA